MELGLETVEIEVLRGLIAATGRNATREAMRLEAMREAIPFLLLCAINLELSQVWRCTEALFC